MSAKERSFAAYEELGLHPYHHAILAVLDEGTRETQGSIADSLGYDRGQLVGLLDELEETAFDRRQRDPADRRRHVVEMTPAGRKALARARGALGAPRGRVPRALDERSGKLHALLLRLAEEHLPHCRFAQSPQK